VFFDGPLALSRTLAGVEQQRMVAFEHRINAVGTYVVGCYLLEPAGWTAPTSYEGLMKLTDPRRLFCLDLHREGKEPWNVSYAFATD
jgi:hypothetical protein